MVTRPLEPQPPPVELEARYGLAGTAAKHYLRPEEPPFLKADRTQTTVLFSGFTWKHDRLIQGAWAGLGYKVRYLPCPDIRACRTGQEYGMRIRDHAVQDRCEPLTVDGTVAVERGYQISYKPPWWDGCFHLL